MFFEKKIKSVMKDFIVKPLSSSKNASHQSNRLLFNKSKNKELEKMEETKFPLQFCSKNKYSEFFIKKSTSSKLLTSKICDEQNPKLHSQISDLHGKNCSAKPFKISNSVKKSNQNFSQISSNSKNKSTVLQKNKSSFYHNKISVLNDLDSKFSSYFYPRNTSFIEKQDQSKRKNQNQKPTKRTLFKNSNFFNLLPKQLLEIFEDQEKGQNLRFTTANLKFMSNYFDDLQKKETQFLLQNKFNHLKTKLSFFKITEIIREKTDKRKFKALHILSNKLVFITEEIIDNNSIEYEEFKNFYEIANKSKFTIHVFETFFEKGKFYTVSEFCKLGSMSTFITTNNPSLPQIKTFFLKILTGLYNLEKIGLKIFKFSKKNILLDDYMNPKFSFIDFKKNYKYSQFIENKELMPELTLDKTGGSGFNSKLKSSKNSENRLNFPIMAHAIGDFFSLFKNMFNYQNSTKQTNLLVDEQLNCRLTCQIKQEGLALQSFFDVFYVSWIEYKTTIKNAMKNPIFLNIESKHGDFDSEGNIHRKLQLLKCVYMNDLSRQKVDRGFLEFCLNSDSSNYFKTGLEILKFCPL